MEQEVKDRAPKPKGLMPKNLQAFIIAGIAFLMIVIMALTGHKRPKLPAAAETPSPTASPIPVDQQKISSLQKDIQQEQIQSAPQVESALLEQQRELAAKRQLEGQNPYGTPVMGTSPNGAYPPGAYAAASQPGSAPPPDPVREDKKKRRYTSLFADNVALSYRKNSPGMQPDQARGLSSQAPVTGAGGPGASNPFESQQRLLDQEGAQLAQEEQMLEQAQAAGLVPKTNLPRPLAPPDRAGKADPQAGANQAVTHSPTRPIPTLRHRASSTGRTASNTPCLRGPWSRPCW